VLVVLGFTVSTGATGLTVSAAVGLTLSTGFTASTAGGFCETVSCACSATGAILEAGTLVSSDPPDVAATTATTIPIIHFHIRQRHYR
jgi:hypothetical protein